LSLEKLCPLVAFYEVDGFEDGCRLCIEILDLGGRGHTLGLHCEDEAIIRAFAVEKPVNRIVVNSPTTQGGVGLTTNLFPSMTLGCGSFGGNITSDNIGPQHLLNIKRVAWATPAYREGAPMGVYRASSEPAAEGFAAGSPWDGLPRRNQAGPEAVPANPGAVTAGGRPPPVMGRTRGPLPGERFSDDDLRRIVEDALQRRRTGRDGS
jgi:hypothetical protein